ncbi:uncharacterized protein LOC123660918 [Melitaea cinxia]|uniref:uncharacterized protein LOC123660918 n=1 Tax=Melitaea cinxia TaxID=113334 RepID=UPI001E274CEB|nr:uncharacterized protein LOC123660918 [Melitaea cinxia]XP_045451903.1 uncharacterized protein LOC123660918 [Melitaea cinxia]
MGKYGLKNWKHENISKTSLHEPGVDVTDNVMSKMARQASPIPTRRNNDTKHRRNSFDLPTDECTDEESDNENILSKSSPATFSCYSEELYNSALQNELSRSRNSSSHSLNNISPHRHNNINTENHLNSSFTLLQENKNKKDKLGSSNHFLIVIVILLLSIVLLYIKFDSDPVTVKYEYDRFQFDNDVKDLKEKYKIEDNSILQVKTGVATIFKNQDTASFIFAYNSNSNNFNGLKFNNFIDDIAATTSRYLRNESNKVHVTIDSSNLIIQTAKEFMNQYQNEVYESGVMLVKDIESVPSQLAMAFHYYCDEYNPLVKRSAIFFTLNWAKCSNSSDKKATHENIEKCLASRWKTVDEEKIGPLLTRVVNIVVDVTQSF